MALFTIDFIPSEYKALTRNGYKLSVVALAFSLIMITAGGSPGNFMHVYLALAMALMVDDLVAQRILVIE